MATKKIKGDLLVENNTTLDGNLSLPNKTASRALKIDGSGQVVESTVTETELERLSGVTGDIQTQLDAKIDDSEKGAANGVATLDGTGKIPTAQIPDSVLGQVEYQGVWDANTNSPDIGASSPVKGDYYKVSVAGATDLDGITDWQVGDWAVYNGATWDKVDNTDQVSSVFGRTGAITANSGDYDANQITYDNTTSGRTSTDVQGVIDELDSQLDGIVSDTFTIKVSSNDSTQGFLEDKLVSSDSSIVIATLNDGADEDINLSVSEANVDHDALQNFVANEHIDHSSVQIATAADSGLTGGGDITATRNLSVDINGTTAETSVAGADEILIYDASVGALRKMTRSDFLSGIAAVSAGDISETSFAMSANVTIPADVTGLSFSNATVRSFDALVSVEIDATAGLYETFRILGIQKNGSWDISVEATGDDSQVDFTITSAGQIQYTSIAYAGFVSGSIKFRAITTSF